MTESSTALLANVPSYDHLMAGPKLNLQLCTKHLVGWPSKIALGRGCLALEKAMKEAAKFYITWGLGGDIKAEEPFVTPMEEVDKIYMQAKKALAVIAAINCLVNLTGQAKLDRKAVLLNQSVLLPTMLVTHLNKIR